MMSAASVRPILIALLLFPDLTGCRNKELEENAPALARADLRKDRIAIAGMVSGVPDFPDTPEVREPWADIMLNQLTREKYGRLPVTSHRELRAVLGDEEYDAMLDAYCRDGVCGSAWLERLSMALGDRARFVAFARLQEQSVSSSQSSDEEKKVKTFSTLRNVRVRVQFYDLTSGDVAWDHLAYGTGVAKEEYDDSDLLETKPDEKALSAIAKAVVNAAAKPDMRYPDAPPVEPALANAFDQVGNLLGGSQKQKEKGK